MMAGHLVKEISDSVDFLQKRKNFDDYNDTAVALRKNLAEQMASAVGNLETLPSKDAGMLLDVLGDTAYGEFTQCVKAAIDSRLSCTASASVKKAGKLVRKPYSPLTSSCQQRTSLWPRTPRSICM
jgi:hypothetical protein